MASERQRPSKRMRSLSMPAHSSAMAPPARVEDGRGTHADVIFFLTKSLAYPASSARQMVHLDSLRHSRMRVRNEEPTGLLMCKAWRPGFRLSAFASSSRARRRSMIEWSTALRSTGPSQALSVR